MAYAPHTNTDVQNQAACGMTPTPAPIIFGCFTEKDYGNVFEYAERRWPDDNFHPDFPHVIYVGNGETRLAKVLETVAWVLVDEDKFEKWHIKQHRHYHTQSTRK